MHIRYIRKGGELGGGKPLGGECIYDKFLNQINIYIAVLLLIEIIITAGGIV